ncbi:MAG TPA: hypothetical protein VD886_02210 [Herpetosiphonaceae bacterium]|nr:hypothetical protein [Herpetosiphonaceae bacterium]
MRLKAMLPDHPEYRKAMIHTEDRGSTYLFLFASAGNVPCSADYWFVEQAGALEYAAETYGIAAEQWIEIADRQPGQQQDLEYDERGALLRISCLIDRIL